MIPVDTGHLTADDRLDLVHELGTVADRAAWLRHARHCAECARELELAREDVRRARAEMPEALAALGRVTVAAPRRRTGLAGAAIAAAAVIALTVWWWPSSPHALVSHLRPLPHDLELVTRRDTGAPRSTDALERGIDAYRAGEHAAAVRALRESDPGEAPGGMRELYLASSLAHLGRFDEALAALDPVPDAGVPEGWRDEVVWTRCVSNYGAGCTARGDSILAVLEARGGDAATRAAALRHDLRTGREPASRR